MMTKMTPAAIVLGVLVAVGGLPGLVAQDAQPARGGRAGSNEMWWVNKTMGGVYTPPMRPLIARKALSGTLRARQASAGVEEYYSSAN